MSVLNCDRAGCTAIMCDRFSSKLQAYLCHNCFGELVQTKPTSVRLWLQTPKSIEDDLDMYPVYDKLFPSRYND